MRVKTVSLRAQCWVLANTKEVKLKTKHEKYFAAKFHSSILRENDYTFPFFQIFPLTSLCKEVLLSYPSEQRL